MDDSIITSSILLSVKKLLGYPPEMHEFDADMIMYINAALNALTQVGVGPPEGFIITGENETYEDMFGEDTAKYNMLKIYLFAKTKPVFETITSPSLLEALKGVADEYAFRMQIQNDPKTTFEEKEVDSQNE